ncbi:Uncharacterized protein PECH_002585 [Penicillium ucsense]|uniref:Acylphosphatase n=1 Tax=Penicillium ucsense TaxID=2839758 RepID=A0A8J8WDT5_9EURO|nr:Uncharacterized protein PECM_002019 [Penicillium ucsense]KAF7730744.1 Uncharacterized protein PECH_002585 [Penicillium ucsense]
MTSRRVAFKVHGTVQGVGFRDFVLKCAAKDNLHGWVRNTHCGRVEGEAQGPESLIEQFLKQVDKGPRHAHVVKLEKREMCVQEGDDQPFVVLRTGESGFHALEGFKE